jgi:hypothetical protein
MLHLAIGTGYVIAAKMVCSWTGGTFLCESIAQPEQEYLAAISNREPPSGSTLLVVQHISETSRIRKKTLFLRYDLISNCFLKFTNFLYNYLKEIGLQFAYKIPPKINCSF